MITPFESRLIHSGIMYSLLKCLSQTTSVGFKYTTPGIAFIHFIAFLWAGYDSKLSRISRIQFVATFILYYPIAVTLHIAAAIANKLLHYASFPHH